MIGCSEISGLKGRVIKIRKSFLKEEDANNREKYDEEKLGKCHSTHGSMVYELYYDILWGTFVGTTLMDF